MSAVLELIVLGLAVLVFIGALIARGPRSRKEDEVADDFEPTVTVITPMLNEGDSIRRTIRSILAQDYPASKLSVIIVDDCSTDDSYEHAVDESRHCRHVTVLRNDVNMGKRRSINRGVRATDSEVIVSVDSDVIIAPDAIRQLVRRFTSDKIAAVGGRVDIRNKRDNWLTRMQSVKYYYGYHFIKNLERAFRTVLCLSGCLAAYRRHVLLELEPVLEGRHILGVAIKYGEDRFLTRQIVKAGYETTMTMDAVCHTEAPNGLWDYFAQQLRWRRSNVVDYFAGMSHIWRIHPVVAIHFYAIIGLFLAYPALLVQSLINGSFWPLMSLHLGVMAIFGVFYRILVHRLPADQRVSAIDLVPLAFILPITYAVLTPVAFLTLDSGKWETRGHEDPDVEVPAVSAAATAVDVQAVAEAALSEEVRAA